ncbi:MAG: hypothetical protein RLZZ595_264 [Bacteroidota bacterium]|jgi:hypothetical protein
MRKLIAILFLAVLAINWLGYDLIVSIIQSKENKSFYSKIEAGDFKRDNLYEIKVDLQLPYTTDWAEFEKIRGTIVVDGVVYNFVERKYENGFMIYKCLPNHRGTELQNARDYFQSLVYDMEKQDKKEDAPKPAAAKKLNIETIVLALQSNEFQSTNQLITFSSFISAEKLDGFGLIPSQPPEA